MSQVPPADKSRRVAGPDGSVHPTRGHESATPRVENKHRAITATLGVLAIGSVVGLFAGDRVVGLVECFSDEAGDVAADELVDLVASVA